ncbi:MAG: ankyrin repeat domain-containing protein [Pseudanabaena sp.]
MNTLNPLKLIFSTLTGLAITVILLPQISEAFPTLIEANSFFSSSELKLKRVCNTINQNTILLKAVRTGNLAATQKALSCKADPNAQEQNGETALMIASANNHVKIVKLLLSHGANVNGGSWIVGYPLMEASREGHLEIAKLLLEKGADVNIMSDEGFTALDAAIVKNQIEVVQFLLNKGANPNRYVAGATPLYDAGYGYTKVVSLLIKHGADVNAKSFGSTTPLAIAIQNNHLDVVNLLKKAGAK